MTPDYINNLYKYFSRFVKKDVIKGNWKQSEESKFHGYDELVSEILAQDDQYIISEIDMFIVSMNEKYVSDKIRNTDKLTLFIEYGSFSYNPTVKNGVSEKLAVTVCNELTIGNNDNLNEILKMNQCLAVLRRILEHMEKDQRVLENCGIGNLICFPAEILPIEPQVFYDRAGWTALFSNLNTA